MPRTEPLGHRLPKGGFLYNGQKPFSEAKSATKVVGAMRAVKGVEYLHPNEADHCIGLLFLFAAEKAHTMYQLGDKFWPMIMKDVRWAQASNRITPQMIQELITRVMKARAQKTSSMALASSHHSPEGAPLPLTVSSRILRRPACIVSSRYSRTTTQLL